MAEKKTIVVAGATGFVGRELLRLLAGEYRLIALTRNPPPGTPAGVEWRRCDLFSLIQCEQALAGAESAVYLVHSMLPSAHLTQGHFEDMDLILADNFARAAAGSGIKQIVYLGGLIPEAESRLSRHLASRLEVEQTLGARGVPLTSLRAGLIVGPGGSSFHMLLSVVRRFKFIPCPKWGRSLTQPIALPDVLDLLRHVLEHPSTKNRFCDIGAPEILTYRQLMERLAGVLGKRRTFFPVPGIRWCKPWLALVSGSPMSLVSPLLESMRHSMVAGDRGLQREAGLPGLPLAQALHLAVAAAVPARGKRRRPRGDGRDVRSVQRIPLPAGKTARWLAEEYVHWLPQFFRIFLKALSDERGNLTIRLRFPRLKLLDLTFDGKRSALSERQLFYISGGFLARRIDRASQRPRLEFRQLLGGKCCLVAIHDYRPTIPWPLYGVTQAKAHLWVMRRFARHVRRQF